MQCTIYMQKLYQCMHDAVRHIKVKQSPPPRKSTLSKPSRTRRNWWSYDCKLTGNRNRLYFYLWKTAGSPTTGQIYGTYRYTCRTAIRECKRLSELDCQC